MGTWQTVFVVSKLEAIVAHTLWASSAIPGMDSAHVQIIYGRRETGTNFCRAVRQNEQINQQAKRLEGSRISIIRTCFNSAALNFTLIFVCFGPKNNVNRTQKENGWHKNKTKGMSSTHIAYTRPSQQNRIPFQLYHGPDLKQERSILVAGPFTHNGQDKWLSTLRLTRPGIVSVVSHIIMCNLRHRGTFLQRQRVYRPLPYSRHIYCQAQ